MFVRTGFGARPDEVWVFFVRLDDLGEKTSVAPLGDRKLFVKHGEDACSFRFKKVECRLVVLKVGGWNMDPLGHADLLLESEHVFVEVVL